MFNKTIALLTLGLIISGLIVFQSSQNIFALSTNAEKNTRLNQDLNESKKAQIIKKIKATNQAQKLETKRLELCKKHETKINEINNKNIEQNQKQITTFHDIENKVKSFYAEKGLTSDKYASAIDRINTTRTFAIATIGASTEITFNCDEASATDPGTTLREMTSTRHDAIKEYKNAIKNLIQVVKGIKA